MFNEVASYIIDDGLAGVPPTYLAKFRHPLFSGGGYKLSSLQAYVRHEGCAEDLSPHLFDVSDVMRIAVLDIRLCNTDRHEGNILVCRSVGPYLRDGESAVDMEIDPVEETTSFLSRDVSVSFSAPTYPTSLETFLAVSAIPSISPTVSRSNYGLVPIDHGFVLPHLLHTSDATFAWLQWPQIKEPLPEALRHIVAKLDCESDVEKLRSTLGAAVPITSLLTLQVCTSFLKMGVTAGLTLFEIGSAMVPTSLSEPSILHGVIVRAIQKVLVPPHFGSITLFPGSPKHHHNRVLRPIALPPGLLSRVDTKSCPIPSPSQLDEAISSPRAVNSIFTCCHASEENVSSSSENPLLNDDSLNKALGVHEGRAILIALNSELEELVNNLVLRTCSLYVS